MSRLHTILDEVLAGRKQLTEHSSFQLLREYAPEKKVELDHLEHEALTKEVKPTPIANAKPDAIRLTRHDLDAILHERRISSVEEIEWLLAHANDHDMQLSEVEELELRHVAARLLANRHIADVRAKNHNAEFIAKTIGTLETQYGDLSQAEITKLEAIRREALTAIQNCKEHKTQRCVCWKPAREALYNLRCEAGPGTPISMAALAVWNSVEAFARDRPQPVSPDQSEGLAGITYNWRHFKCPDYMQSIQENAI